MKNRFGKSDRLIEPVDFKRVFAANKVIKNRQLVLFYVPNDLEKPRLGLAISKKTASRAHERNRIKRIAREWFRVQKSMLPFVDIVVVARHSAPTCNNEILFNSFAHLQRLLNKALTQELSKLKETSSGLPDG